MENQPQPEDNESKESKTKTMDKKGDSKRLRCSFCNMTFGHKHNLTSHQKSTNCLHCNTIFPCKKLFHRHLLSIGSKESKTTPMEEEELIQGDSKTVNCSFCNKTLSRKHSLKIHQGTGHYSMKCLHCNTIFPCLTLLNQHKKSLRNTAFRCKICSDTFTTSSSLGRHVNEIHNHKCQYCLKNHRSKALLIQHMAEKHSVEVKCDICSLVFTKKVYFNQHMKLRHTKSEKSVTCEICGTLNSSIQEFKAHHSKCHVGSEFQCKCTECNMVFSTIQRFNSHSKIHSQTTDYKYIECQLCNRVFKRRDTLVKHYREKHPKEEPRIEYKCLDCSKIFNNKRQVRAHSKIHNRNGIFYECVECEAHFKTQAELVIHLRTHIDDDSSSESSEDDQLDENDVRDAMSIDIAMYECDQCDANFESFHELENHGKVHIKRLELNGFHTPRLEDCNIKSESDLIEPKDEGVDFQSFSNIQVKQEEIPIEAKLE